MSLAFASIAVAGRVVGQSYQRLALADFAVAVVAVAVAVAAFAVGQ